MAEFDESPLYGETSADFSRALTKAIQASSLEVKTQLQTIRDNYLATYGFDGFYEKLNGKSIRQMIEEYVPGNPKILAAGEVDGLKYVLYDAPDEAAKTTQGESQT